MLKLPDELVRRLDRASVTILIEFDAQVLRHFLAVLFQLPHGALEAVNRLLHSVDLNTTFNDELLSTLKSDLKSNDK